MRKRGYGRSLFLEWPPFVVGLSKGDLGCSGRARTGEGSGDKRGLELEEVDNRVKGESEVNWASVEARIDAPSFSVVPVEVIVEVERSKDEGSEGLNGQ